MASDGVIEVGAYRVDLVRQRIVGPKGEHELSPLSCRLLARLSEAGGDCRTRAELIEDLWQGNELVGEPALNRLVSETRASARQVCDEPLIKTVQKRGYALVDYSGVHTGQTDRARTIILPKRWFVWLAAIAAIAAIAGVAVMVNGWFEAQVAQVYYESL